MQSIANSLPEEGSYTCMNGCGTQIVALPYDENISNSEVVFMNADNETVVSSHLNAVVLCSHVYKCTKIGRRMRNRL